MAKRKEEKEQELERLQRHWAASRSGEFELQRLMARKEWQTVVDRKRQVKTAYLLYVIEGSSPLLLHSSTAMKLATARLERKVIPTPEEEAEAGVLRDDQGHLIVPQEGVLLGMRHVARSFRIGKERAASVLASAVFVPAELQYVPVRRDGVPLKTYDAIDIRRVVVQGQGVMRARAVVNLPWEVMGVLQYDPDQIAVEIVAEILSLAGTKSGLGDYRPQKGGAFGRYVLRELKVARPGA
jgi:hypothetical protein